MSLFLVNRYILFKYAISKNHKDTLKIENCMTLVNFVLGLPVL